MRILQVIPVFSTLFGGPVRVVRSISNELAKRHKVTVYTTSALDHKRDFKGSPAEVKSDRYRVLYFPRLFKSSGFNISPTMARAFQTTLNEFDIVHVHSWRQFQDMSVHYYSKKYGVPYILQAHGSLPRIMTKQMLKWIYDVSFGYRLLRDASKVIALSQTEAQQCRSMGVPEEKIKVIPNGIELSEYGDLPPRGSFRKKFKISKDKKIILYLGRVHETKGVDLLVKAYAYLIRNMKYNNAVLVLAGPDDGYLTETMSLSDSLSISDLVLFTGFISREDKLKALVDADLFVTPSFYGFPVTFLEACATGTPIITTTLGDSLEWIDGNVGYVTPPTYRDLAKAILAIISDDNLHMKFSRNCREVVRSEFSLGKVVDRLEKVYNEVTERLSERILS